MNKNNNFFSRKNQQLPSDYFSTSCSCSQDVSSLVKNLKYREFFYFDDTNFFSAFPKIANQVNQILGSDQ